MEVETKYYIGMSMTKHYLLLIYFFMINSLSSVAQTEIEQLQSEVYEKVMSYEKNSSMVVLDSNLLLWFQTDTFDYVNYTSAIRSRPRWDTLKISIRFETGWSEELIQETKNSNTERIESLKKTYLAYMDSISWRGYKITKGSFESNVVMHLKMKYPVQFSKEESEQIRLIKECPHFLVGNVGVFLDCSYTGIDPPEVKKKFIDKLEFVSRDLFDSQEVYYGSKIYQ